MAELIRYDLCDRLATVTLHRLDKRNALHHRLVTELKGALAEAAVRVVVLTGAGKIFSAGADLDTQTPHHNAAGNVPDESAPLGKGNTWGVIAFCSAFKSWSRVKGLRM